MIREQIRNFEWHSHYWIVAGLFSVMTFILILPTGAGSASIFLACSAIYLLFHSAGHFAVKRLAMHERWFLASMTLFPLSMAFSILFHAQSVAWHYFEEPSRFLLALPIYWAIRQSGATPVGLVAGSIAGAAGAGALAIFQWTILEIPRPGGFANPIPFADIALLLVLVASAPVSLPKAWGLLRPLGVGLGVVAVILAQTRGAWIAIPFLTWMAMGWFPGRWSTVVRRCISVVLIGGALLIVILVLSESFTATSGVLNDFVPRMRVASLLVRLETWQAAWALFCERPWAGVGVGHYAREVQTLLETTGLSPAHLRSAMTHAHNDFLHLGATMGVIGILGYLVPLSMIYLIGRHLCRVHCGTMGVMLKCFAVGQGIFSLTQTQLSHNISTTFFAATAVSLVALGFNDLERKQPPLDTRSGKSCRDRSAQLSPTNGVPATE